MRRIPASVAGPLAAMLIAMFAAACGTPAPEPVTLTISGDSIRPMTRDTASTDPAPAECAVLLLATVEGPEGENIVIRHGGIQYYWWESGVAIELHEWTDEELLEIWPATTIHAGHATSSLPVTFSQPEPAQPVRAEVRFRYAMSTADGEHETEPYRFYCF